MVNKTQFYKTKVALAVVLSLGLAACGDSEGDAGSTSSSTSVTDSTQNTVGNQDELTVTVKGLVIDSNGNPIVGAAVWLGNTETMTSGGGQYEFTDINVTDVVGVNNEGNESDDNTGHQSLTITVLGTDTYLGAIVTVSPDAQVNNTGGSGDQDGVSNSDTTIQTFVSGYTVEAGTAVLPMLNAGTYGYVRDCRTGQPLADTADILSLDFVTVNEDADSTIGTQLTNSEDNHVIASDADGMFSLAALAANSSYTISAKQGWAITSGLGFTSDTDTTVTVVADAGPDSTTTSTNTVVTNGVTVTTVVTAVVVNADAELTTTTVVTTTTPVTLISTGSEDSSEFLGTLEVCPVDFVETDLSAPPMIKSIDGQVGTSELTGDADSTYDTVIYPYAALTQGVVNDFVINFSEEMASTFDMSEARVKVDGDTVADATVTLAADGKSAMVTFVEDLDEGSKVDVWFPHWTALDANDDLFLVDNSSIGYDAVEEETTSKAFYTHAFFCTFLKPEDTASIVLGPQVFNADATEDGNSTDLSDYSLAFQDNFEEAAGTAITQLNDGDSASGARLVALAAARGVTVTIDQDYAVVDFDDSDAANFATSWKDEDGNTIATAIVHNTTDDTLHLNGASHNDVLKVTPINGFGDAISSGAVSVTLVDAIAPTTVLQESYDITSSDTGHDGNFTGGSEEPAPRNGEAVVSGTTANTSFGNGGEISQPGGVDTAAGNPVIHIQPRHLGGVDADGDIARNHELDTLTVGMAARLTDDEADALGLAAPTALSVSAIGTHDMPIYDATAIADWAATTAKIGVAFNENTTLTAVAPVFDGSTALSGYAALNNVVSDIDGNTVAVDLVTFDTPDVLALSLDAGADLSFVGAVTDSRGNAATANAQVFIQDTFPPMMTAAVWDGETLDLTFNEPVVPTTGDVITVIDPAATVNDEDITLTATNWTVAGNVLSITLTGGQNTDIAPLFVDGTNTEFLYDDDANDADEEQHALINWDDIEDSTGNSWTEFTPGGATPGAGLEDTADAINRWEVVAPRFLAVNAVGAFTYSVATSGYDDGGAGGDDNGAVVYTITFTHPIDLTLDAGVNHFTDAIDAADGIATPDPITNLTYSTSTTEGTAVLNALFVMDFDGAGVNVTNDTFSEGVVSATITAGSLAISNGNTTLTLTIGADAESLIFGTSTFGFKTTVTSAINSLETSAGNFNWQNNN